jgi:beta-glucosidase
LLRNGQIKAIAIYGSPYTVEWLLPDLTPDLPWAFSYGQMPTAQKIMWEFLLGSEILENVRQNAFI